MKSIKRTPESVPHPAGDELWHLEDTAFLQYVSLPLVACSCVFLFLQPLQQHRSTTTSRAIYNNVPNASMHGVCLLLLVCRSFPLSLHFLRRLFDALWFYFKYSKLMCSLDSELSAKFQLAMQNTLSKLLQSVMWYKCSFRLVKWEF